MLSKNHRLSRYEITALKSNNPFTLNGQSLNIVYKFSPQGPKFAFTVSTKIAKKAVTRNFLKRRLYNLINPSVWPAGEYHFYAKHTLAKCNNTDLAKELDSILRIITKTPSPK